MRMYIHIILIDIVLGPHIGRISRPVQRNLEV